MADRLRVACVQLNATQSKAENIERAERLVARAASAGADLVLMPEKWNGIGPADVVRSIAESLDDGETVEAMSGWARAHGITLVGGSIVEQRESREKLSNTCVVFDPEGEVAAVYRKIHMFDVEVGGHVYRESETEEPGDGPATTEVEGWNLGLTVCYDLRFPELYRILALEGCEAVTVPAAFTLYT
ncbi:MAG TPA: nitrilase-related carbon-nitrogen hydrolase, partial [Gaiellaceae bacterium]